MSYFLNDARKTQPPKSQLNLDTGKLTSQIEHITWHTDKIHVKLQDGTVVDEIELSEPLLSNPPILTPLYVESIYFDKKPPLTPAEDFVPWNGAIIQNILDINSTNKFSLVFLLTPENHSTDWVLSNLKLTSNGTHTYSCASLCTESYRPGRIKIWEGWDMIVLTTSFARKISNQIHPKIGTDFRVPNYKNVSVGLNNLLIQTSAQKETIEHTFGPCNFPNQKF